MNIQNGREHTRKVKIGSGPLVELVADGSSENEMMQDLFCAVRCQSRTLRSRREPLRADVRRQLLHCSQNSLLQGHFVQDHRLRGLWVEHDTYQIQRFT